MRGQSSRDKDKGLEILGDHMQNFRWFQYIQMGARHYLKLQRAFKAAADIELGQYCYPVQFEQGCLHLITSTAEWATRTRFLEKELLTSLCQQPEFIGIESIRCQVQPSLLVNAATV